MPPHGALYRSAIARMFRQCGKGKALFFEESRAYIEFERPPGMDQQSSVIFPGVYKAIKMRHLRIPLNLFISEARTRQMDQLMEERNAMADRNQRENNRLRSNKIATPLSSRGSHGVQSAAAANQIDLPKTGYLEIVTSVVIDAGHFWAQKPDSESATRLQMLQEKINMNEGRNLKQNDRKNLRVGMLCVALYEEDELYYRAKIVSFKDRNYVEVFFLDFGNAALMHVNQLRKMENEFLSLPFQAFECVLCEVAPVPTAHCPAGSWSIRATQRFIEVTANRKLAAKVYSLMRNVLRVDLYDTSTEEDIHINQLLIDEGFAMFQEESHASRMAHQNASEEGVDNTTWLDTVDMSAMDVQDDVCTKVMLRGPESPIEMSFYNITNIGRMRSARIEQGSVNGVILNDQPQDPHPRFLVAANIGINTTGSTVVARDTTLMPNIHGLLPIVSLLFSPFAELRTDPENRKYTGALVGLGYDPSTGHALLPDHDIELVFEVEITQEDIILINSVRTAINMALQSEAEVAGWGTPAVERIQNSSKHLITKLILKPRETKKPWAFPRPCRWDQIDPAYKLQPEKNETECALYTLHQGIAISNRPLDEDEESRIKQTELLDKLKWLRSLEGRTSEQFTQEVVCPLCNVLCRHPRGVSIHLRSASHRDLEYQLYGN